VPSALGIGASNAHVELVKRPAHLDPPATLSKSPPLPAAAGNAEPEPPAGEEQRPDPTRYGDWEKNGVAVDF
jgi:hypothetical protein